MEFFRNIIRNGQLKVLAGILFFVLSPFLLAQEDIDKEVIVVRAFEPSVTDASKINLLPSITDTISVTPVFSYSILPIPISTDFEVEPITAARMSAEPVSKLYGSYLSLGLGSYISPFAELSVNNLRHDKYSGGIYLKHHSSQGRLRLDNNEKAFSQFSDNDMLFYGKRMGRRNVLSAEAGLQSNGFHFYGFDTDIDTVPEKDDIRQQFMFANAGLRFQSSNPDSLHLNYDVRLNYNYFQDRLDVAEHAFLFRSGFNKFIRSQVIGADLEVDYFNNTFLQDTSNLVVKVSPWFSKADDEWEIFAGVHAYYDQLGEKSGLYFHPRASLQFSIIRNYVIPFVGIDGRLNVNHYRRVAFENAFIVPGLFVENSNESMDLYAGVKGNFTRDISFNLKASYIVVDDMHFFLNESIGFAGNKFNVVYDDVEVIRYTGEIGASFSDRFSIYARTNYNKYNMKVQERPWHRPLLDGKLSARYNFRDKIILNTDIFYIGNRYAMSYGEDDSVIELDAVADINLGFEYRYSRILSGFINLNNLGNSRYYKWNNYPVQGFSITAGFTYSL